MLAGFILLAILFWIYFSLSPRAQDKVHRVLFPLFLVSFAWVCCALLGVLINSALRLDDYAEMLRWAYTLPLTTLVKSQVEHAQNPLVGVSWVGGYFFTLPFDIVFGTMKLAFSLKFLFLTFMMVVWMVIAALVRTYIVDPQSEQAKRDEENGVFDQGESFHQQVWRLVAEKERDDAVKAAEAAARARNVPAPEPVKSTPVVYDKYPRPRKY